MRSIVVCVCLAMIALPAIAMQESLWVEKLAVMSVGQSGCGIPMDRDAAETVLGRAEIELALSKTELIERGKTRAKFIVKDIDEHGTGNAFCQSFKYYLQNGYPR